MEGLEIKKNSAYEAWFYFILPFSITHHQSQHQQHAHPIFGVQLTTGLGYKGLLVRMHLLG